MDTSDVIVGVAPFDGPAIDRGRINDSLSCFLTQTLAGQKCVFLPFFVYHLFSFFFYFCYFLQIICTNQEFSTET